MFHTIHQKLQALSASRLCAFAVALLAALGLPTIAQAQVTLPDPGVDVGGAITAAITALGVVVTIAVGGYFAYLIVRKGMQWARRAFG